MIGLIKDKLIPRYEEICSSAIDQRKIILMNMEMIEEGIIDGFEFLEKLRGNPSNGEELSF